MLDTPGGRPANEPADEKSVVHDFCSTDTQARLTSWNDVLDLQVRLFFDREIEALNALPRWIGARSVLDVGCGNGRFLSRVATRCPSKRYHGIDRSAEFVADARRSVSGVGFTVGDFGAPLDGKTFDVIVMRFVVQHLQDWNAVLGRARQLLCDGGALIVIEPDLDRFDNVPPLPRFNGMLEDYGREAAARGCLRANLKELADRALAESWQLGSDTGIDVMSRGRADVQPALALYQAWTTLCERSGYVQGDFPAVRTELECWGQQDESVSRIGLRVLELQP